MFSTLMQYFWKYVQSEIEKKSTLFCIEMPRLLKLSSALPPILKSTNFASKYHSTIVCCLDLIIHSKIQLKKSIIKRHNPEKSYCVLCVFSTLSIT